MQPLHDNLESQVYEIFETDPVKYVKYQEAIAPALSLIYTSLCTQTNSEPKRVKRSASSADLTAQENSKHKKSLSSFSECATDLNQTKSTLDSSIHDDQKPSHRDNIENLLPITEESENCETFVHIVVAGAGRGPLIHAVLEASNEENVPVFITAIEKNRNAFYTCVISLLFLVFIYIRDCKEAKES